MLTIKYATRMRASVGVAKWDDYLGHNIKFSLLEIVLHDFGAAVFSGKK